MAVSALGDEEIRRALGEAPRISFARRRLGHILIDRERLLDMLEREGHGRDEASERVEAWVDAVGGRTRLLPAPISQSLRPGRQVAPDPGPPVIALEIPSDRL